MILVDSSIWIDHLRRPIAALQQLLRDEKVLCHPMVLGEIAMGNFRQRNFILGEMRDLSMATSASHSEVLYFISHYSLHVIGIGYIDAHLLAATRLTPGSSIWTGDKRLQGAAERFLLDYQPNSNGS